jgi:site-specific DNA-methyltransferase (adenine-specific)/modification methylase
MKPYFQTPAATLYHGDCLDVVPMLKAAIGAVVADPPYGIGWAGMNDSSGVLAKQTKFTGVTIHGDDAPFDPSPWLTFPVVILWGANYYCDRLPPSSQWLVWDKRDGTTSNHLADCELAWTSGTGRARLFHHRWMGMIKAANGRW